MRILLVAPLYPPAIGGCATYFNILTDCLKDHEEVDLVAVLTAKLEGVPKEEASGKVRIFRHLPPLPDASSRIGWIMGESFRIPISYFTTLKLGRSLDVDVVHVHKTRSYSGAVLAARSLGVPSIVDVRDLDSLHFFKGANGFIACSLSVKEMVLDAGIPPAAVHHLPVPFETKMERDLSAYDGLPKDVKEGEGYLLFVGDITEMKGIPELIKGFIRVRRGHPDLDLVLVGRNLMGKRLAELIGDEEAIHATGPLSHPETMGLMEHAEIVILPSRSEGFPRTCIEALRMGAKVIFPSVVPEFRESVGDFVLSEITPDSIELKVKEVLSRDDRPNYPLERHVAEKICKDVLEIYKDLLK